MHPADLKMLSACLTFPFEDKFVKNYLSPAMLKEDKCKSLRIKVNQYLARIFPANSAGVESNCKAHALP